MRGLHSSGPSQTFGRANSEAEAAARQAAEELGRAARDSVSIAAACRQQLSAGRCQPPVLHLGIGTQLLARRSM